MEKATTYDDETLNVVLRAVAARLLLAESRMGSALAIIAKLRSIMPPPTAANIEAARAGTGEYLVPFVLTETMCEAAKGAGVKGDVDRLWRAMLDSTPPEGGDGI